MANYTPNYQLHQWEPQDPFLRTDFNQDLQKIDNALEKHEQLIAAHEEAIAKFGNCQFFETQYAGTDVNQPVVQAFPQKPMVIFVADMTGPYCFWAFRGMDQAPTSTAGIVSLALTWSDREVSWFCDGSVTTGFNDKKRTYRVLALLEAGA